MYEAAFYQCPTHVLLFVLQTKPLSLIETKVKLVFYRTVFPWAFVHIVLDTTILSR